MTNRDKGEGVRNRDFYGDILFEWPLSVICSLNVSLSLTVICVSMCLNVYPNCTMHLNVSLCFSYNCTLRLNVSPYCNMRHNWSPCVS